jgi:DNA-binding NtrC family response regulator
MFPASIGASRARGTARAVFADETDSAATGGEAAMQGTVLVIDGGADLGDVFAQVVNGNGSCVVARDLDSAATLIDTVRLDWIALDLDAAGDHAAEWLTEIARKRPKLAERTLIAMNPPYKREIAEALEALGASILMKPLRAERLRIELEDEVATSAA